MTRNRKHIVNVVKHGISGRFSFKLYQVNGWNERVQVEIKKKESDKKIVYDKKERNTDNASHV